jgi:transcriptional regulator with XRE-family HTH domain
MAKQNPLSAQQKIGLRIKELRNKAKYSQEELGQYSNLDRTYINSVENDRRNISIRAIAQISSVPAKNRKAIFAKSQALKSPTTISLLPVFPDIIIIKL